METQWLENAMLHDLTDSCLECSRFAYFRLAHLRSNPPDKILLEAAADLGHAVSMMALSKIYKLEGDTSRAKEWEEKAIANGYKSTESSSWCNLQ